MNIVQNVHPVILMIDFKLDPVKVVKCNECGVEVKVNANYPISEVSCQPWYCPVQKEKSVDEV